MRTKRAYVFLEGFGIDVPAKDADNEKAVTEIILEQYGNKTLRELMTGDLPLINIESVDSDDEEEG